MCFVKTIDFIKDYRHYITEILNKDIIVIKILYKEPINRFFFKKYNYYSPYEGYKYIKGKLNISPLGIFINKMSTNCDYRIVINEGFHSFRIKKDANDYKTKLFNDSKAVLCKCIIPKGSTIVYNDSEIVSNQIIFIEELK
jgi:hypothetical protein